ncbi:hypothetical protein AQUCO_01500462v1 [Aquilegia coerulea]|uniref:Mitochondrial import inner membrane translocase subunit TIM22 n=1 Tax=Aquilegia coerulea TaxID=218851 RepID=A0A2G5DTT8_AQUCA|nr:hypothetical protein AQUCO_01500462v1 [Aquilegia coerulea]
MASSSSSSITTTPYTRREPKFLGPATKGFVMGLLAGIPIYMIKGIYNSPNGQRFNGVFRAVGNKAPRLGCTLATWFVLDQCIVCAIANYRQKNDVVNPLMSMGIASGLINFRKGFLSASKWAILTPPAYVACVLVQRGIESVLAANEIGEDV